jgi:outer membrane biosynthesis protein TonB
MSSVTMKTLIVNAILKIAGENPALNREGEPTAEEARNMFIRALVAELFPECPSVDLPAPEPIVDQLTNAMSELSISIPTAEKKKRGPMSEEAKAAMKAKREATKAAKASPAAAPAPPTPEPAPAPAAPKKPKKKASAEPEPAPAAPPALPASPKKKAAPKKKVDSDANLAKIDPTWRKHLKAADKDRAKELEPELLAYLNKLSKDDFNAKKAEEHVQDFVASWRTAAVQAQEAELTEVTFDGKEYLYNPETKRVYEITGYDADGTPNANPVGYVGMAAFKDMVVPE